MKQLFGALALTGTCLVYLLACNKHDNKGGASSKTGTLSFNQTNVQKGQPLVAWLPAAKTTDIRWTVTPSPITHVVSAKDQATILFGQPGTYRVTATALGSDSSGVDSTSGTVTVSDYAYEPVIGSSDTSSLAGDQITLKPEVDTAGNLLLLAQTTKGYGCSPYLLYNTLLGPVGQPGITIGFYEVISMGAGPCNGVENPASALIFPAKLTSGYPDGTYPFVATMAGMTYTGSFTVTSTGYSFSWNYSSGITIAPLQINK